MTVPFPLDAFEDARPLRKRRPRPHMDTDKLAGIGITLAVHVAILGLALTAVHVARPKVMRELSVTIAPERLKVVEEVKPLPKIAAPSVITPPLPEYSVRVATPLPVVAQPPVVNTAPLAPVTAPQKPTGESRDSYLGRVLAQLNRFKQYPRAARQARIEGVVMLHFVMDVGGKVQSAEVAKSSGHLVLYTDALALIQRAQPLPALPANFSDPPSRCRGADRILAERLVSPNPANLETSTLDCEQGRRLPVRLRLRSQ
jgi:TonB family protein